MKRGKLDLLALSILLALLVGAAAPTFARVSEPAASTEEAGELDGRTLFVEVHKCSMCHAVPAAGVQAKVKSEKMRGPEFAGKVELDLETIATFVRKEADKDGALHKKEFKGSNEELQAILDWLGSFEKQQ